MQRSLWICFLRRPPSPHPRPAKGTGTGGLVQKLSYYWYSISLPGRLHVIRFNVSSPIVLIPEFSSPFGGKQKVIFNNCEVNGRTLILHKSEITPWGGKNKIKLNRDFEQSLSWASPLDPIWPWVVWKYNHTCRYTLHYQSNHTVTWHYIHTQAVIWPSPEMPLFISAPLSER